MHGRGPGTLAALALALAVTSAACGPWRESDSGLRLPVGNTTTTTPSGPEFTLPPSPTTALPAPIAGPAATKAPARPSRSSTVRATGTTTAPDPTTSTAPPTTQPPPPRLQWNKVATLEQPTSVAFRANDPAIYITERAGLVRRVLNGQVDPNPVLDLRGVTNTTDGEQGLIGITFSPDGSLMYVHYTGSSNESHIIEVTMASGAQREVLRVDRPGTEHNGGQLAFGPDGMLWLSFGDGERGGDPNNNAQNLQSLLGKILRIDPHPSATAAYTIPPDNPFASRTDLTRKEIWAYGFRNPWRFSFDGPGRLWIGDVGESNWEEVDRQPAGSAGGDNYGWNYREGTHSGYNSGTPPPNMIDPSWEYPHSSGRCAVVGGYVYHGSEFPTLQGAYLFADYCTGVLESLTPNGSGVDHAVVGPKLPFFTSFGQSADGEVWGLSIGQGQGLYRLG
jgi:glucose/arabinose dehydrogenase